MTAPTVEPTSLIDLDPHAFGDPHAEWRWMHAPVLRHPAGEMPGLWSFPVRSTAVNGPACLPVLTTAK